MQRLFQAPSSILTGAVKAGNCTWDSGEALGSNARVGISSEGPRRRSGVLKAKVIMIPPWDSLDLKGGVLDVRKSSLLELFIMFNRLIWLLKILLFYSALSTVILAASILV